MSAPALIHDAPRRASWFELFFDLVFVVAIAALAGWLSHHYDLAGAAVFAGLFLVLWWLWLGHTFHASRFDRDRPDQWAIGLIQMLAVVFIAHGAGDAPGARAWAFAGGVAVFKALLAAVYLREAGRPGLARLCRLYGAIYSLQAVLWAASIWVEPGVRLVLWGLALALDLLSPRIVAAETPRAPPHPEHLPERFGLFTIILLGETAAAAVHALDHGEVLHGETLAVALAGALLGFLIWVGYFVRARGHAERHVADAAAAQAMRLWAWGHVPLYLGIASLGAGTVHLAHAPAPGGAAPWILAGGMALAMAGITIVSLATARRGLGLGWPFALPAAAALALPALTGSAVGLMAGLAGLAAVQIGLSVALARRAGPRGGGTGIS
jgi:low temperature requirement protein LtrA